MKKLIVLLSALLLMTLCGCKIQEPEFSDFSKSTSSQSQSVSIPPIQGGTSGELETSRIPI